MKAEQILPEDAAGKTVRGIFMDDGRRSDRCIIAFTDGTFCNIEIDACPEVEPWLTADMKHPDHFCSAFGVSSGVYDERVFQEREKRIADMNANAQDRRDREAYERLKAKFGQP